MTSAANRKYRIWFWATFSVAFVATGLLLPAALVFLTAAWGLAFGAGPSPFWLLLAYPTLIVGSWVATKTNPDRPGPHGMLLGTAWGLLVLVSVAAALIFLAPSAHKSNQHSARPSVTCAWRSNAA